METIEPEIVQDAEVLPQEGTQWVLDWGYSAGQFLKRNVIALTIGITIGVVICYAINSRK